MLTMAFIDDLIGDEVRSGGLARLGRRAGLLQLFGPHERRRDDHHHEAGAEAGKAQVRAHRPDLVEIEGATTTTETAEHEGRTTSNGTRRGSEASACLGRALATQDSSNKGIVRFEHRTGPHVAPRGP